MTLGSARRVGAPGALLLLLACLSFCSLARATDGPPQADVRLLLDASSEFRHADPEDQRAALLAHVVRLLPDGAKAGIWLFADEVAELVPHGEVDANWRKAALATIAAGIDSDLGTHRNIPAALQAALYDYETRDGLAQTSILMLTDGRIDVAQSPMLNAGAAREVLETTAPRLYAAGIPVYTLALSADADGSFLEALADVSGGLSMRTGSVKNFSSAFLRLFDRAVPLPRLPLRGEGFTVDAGAAGFTVVLAAKAVSGSLLVAPDGTRYDRETPGLWQRGGDIALLSIDAPAAGRWQLQATGDTEVLVRSGVPVSARLEPRQPAPGEAATLTVWYAGLQASGQPELDIAISGPNGYSAHLGDEALVGPAQDAYRVALPAMPQPGEYRLRITLLAGEIERELSLFLEVVAPPDLPTLSTRGTTPERDDFRLPLIALGSVIVAALLVLWVILRRRKRRKIAIWEKRAEQLRANANTGMFRVPQVAPESASPLESKDGSQ